MWIGGMEHTNRADKVDVDDGEEVLVARVVERLVAEDPGVGDHRAIRPKASTAPATIALAPSTVEPSCVSVGDRGATGGLDFLGNRGRGALVDTRPVHRPAGVVHDYPGAEARQE
jgi:hypothetical protein